MLINNHNNHNNSTNNNHTNDNNITNSSISSDNFKSIAGSNVEDSSKIMPNLVSSQVSPSVKSSGQQQVFFTDAFKNEPVSPKQQFPSFNPPSNQMASPIGQLPYNYNSQQQMVYNNSQQQYQDQQYQGSFFHPSPQQQQHQYQQLQQQQPQHQSPHYSSHFNQSMNSPSNSNFLNAHIQCAGGSLPDLTSFQFQANQTHQSVQLQEYNNKRNNVHQQQQQYDTLSAQLLQPNFQQHNHIGPVKPTHDSSVSPTRNSRYSPTNIGK